MFLPTTGCTVDKYTDGARHFGPEPIADMRIGGLTNIDDAD